MAQAVKFHESVILLKDRIKLRIIQTGDKTWVVGNRRALRHQRKKLKMYLQQRGRCCFCERMMYATAGENIPKKWIATIEHIIPRSKGGSNKQENLLLSCDDCNNLRGDRRRYRPSYRLRGQFGLLGQGTLTPWVVYILECADGSLYTGCTNDLTRRVGAHNSGRGAKYTRSRLPVVLRYSESASGRSSALRRELAIKKMTRAEKLSLIRNK